MLKTSKIAVLQPWSFKSAMQKY